MDSHVPGSLLKALGLFRRLRAIESHHVLMQHVCLRSQWSVMLGVLLRGRFS